MTIEQITEYLRSKAEAAGLECSGPEFRINRDAARFTIKSATGGAKLEISGLEFLQNSTLAAMESLLTSRFKNAVSRLNEVKAA